MVSHVLAVQCLDDGESKLKAGSRPTAREDQAVPLHTVLRVAVMTFKVRTKKGYILTGSAGQQCVPLRNSMPSYSRLVSHKFYKTQTHHRTPAGTGDHGWPPSAAWTTEVAAGRGEHTQPLTGRRSAHAGRMHRESPCCARLRGEGRASTLVPSTGLNGPRGHADSKRNVPPHVTPRDGDCFELRHLHNSWLPLDPVSCLKTGPPRRSCPLGSPSTREEGLVSQERRPKSTPHSVTNDHTSHLCSQGPLRPS